jgi:hypothetical protein
MVGTPTYVKPPVLVAEPPAVVTTTFFAPTVPAGVLAVIDEAVEITLVAALPSIVTVEPAKLVPTTVIDVPPTNGPELGETLAIVGTATYVYAPAWVADPPAVVTTTIFAPTVPAGVLAVIDEAVAVTLVAGFPSMVTVALARLVPAMVITVPPTNGPELGETVAMVGTAT